MSSTPDIIKSVSSSEDITWGNDLFVNLDSDGLAQEITVQLSKASFRNMPNLLEVLSLKFKEAISVANNVDIEKAKSFRLSYLDFLSNIVNTVLVEEFDLFSVDELDLIKETLPATYISNAESIYNILIVGRYKLVERFVSNAYVDNGLKIKEFVKKRILSDNEKASVQQLKLNTTNEKSLAKSAVLLDEIISLFLTEVPDNLSFEDFIQAGSDENSNYESDYNLVVLTDLLSDYSNGNFLQEIVDSVLSNPDSLNKIKENILINCIFKD